METASWREIFPASASQTRKLWNLRKEGSLRITSLRTVICQARESGYHLIGVGGGTGSPWWVSEVRPGK